MSKMPPDAIPLMEAAAKEGVHHTTIRRWINGKHGPVLPVYRRGFRLYVSPMDIEAYQEAAAEIAESRSRAAYGHSAKAHREYARQHEAALASLRKKGYKV